MVVDVDGIFSCRVVVVGGFDVIRVVLWLADEIGEVVMQFVLATPVGPESRRVVTLQLSNVPNTCRRKLLVNIAVFLDIPDTLIVDAGSAQDIQIL